MAGSWEQGMYLGAGVTAGGTLAWVVNELLLGDEFLSDVSFGVMGVGLFVLGTSTVFKIVALISNPGVRDRAGMPGDRD